MMNKIEHLSKRIFSCSLCDRLREVTPVPYPHIYFNSGKNNNLVLCVGRNPGLEHDYSNINIESFINIYKNRWLKSRAGKYMLSNTSKEFIFNVMFWTNICKCSSPNNSQLIYDEIENCRIFLQLQISILKPKKIFTFGREAFNWFFPNKKLNKNFGIELQYGEYKVIPFYHYAYLARNGNLELYNKQKEILKDISNKYILKKKRILYVKKK